MKTFLMISCALFVSASLLAAASPESIRPVGRDGQPLNLDFETGTLKDWTATGHAFDKQPIKGDTVAARRTDSHSRHQGNYWIGTYEVAGDEPKGTLTSVPFKVAHRFASFLIGGGSQAGTRLELAGADDQKVFFRAAGADTEDMRPVVVDLNEQVGKEIFIRLVDESSDGWGHINFDHFVFYDERPKLANETEAAKPRDVLPPDAVKFSGLSPEEAAKAMTLPTGFRAQLFAGEPDVVQPIAFAMDDRGRLWVAEGMTYPQRAPEGQGKDRILIFEDTNGDGKFDKRTVFIEGLNLVSGLEVGFGGVWVGAAPYLYFIPVKPGEDKPAGPPQVLLDGWGYGDTHETLNTFTWGPDGWLYGCHGVFTQSNVGKPGAPDGERTKINAGVWRYHPTKHIFELFAEGTSNPWGIDFDANGQCFIEACVIPHLWHMIQGGRYQRQGGQHFNPYIFDDIKTIGDHVHYAGSGGPHAGNGRSDSAGGGHAHAGLLIYQGDSWPKEFRGNLFMNNIHGSRINMDVPEHQGSGFVGHHGADFLLANDTWSQILNLLSDQDGSVYMIDWYDKNQCHSGDPKVHDRSNGRIFKIVYANTKTTTVNLAKQSSAELVKLLSSANIWQTRHAQRLLQERGPDPAVHKALVKLLNERHSLRALWALHATGGLTEPIALAQLASSDEYVRAWTIQLLCENKTASPAMLDKFASLAKSDPSPVVRLYLASALQRLPIEQRWPALEALVAHAEDANDHNLPLMYWYAAEPAVAANAERGLDLAEKSKVPHLREFITRRIAAK